MVPNPVFCALDVPSRAQALALAQGVMPHVGGFKVGLELFCAQGIEIASEITAMGLPVFLDVKLLDIPNTVTGAIRALEPSGASLITLHPAGGAAMMRQAQAAAQAWRNPPGLLAVTMLTSLDDDDLRATGISSTAEEQVLRMVGLAMDCGIEGIVCSPREISAIRAHFGTAPRLVVPGIQTKASATTDQKRIMTPVDAMAAGADQLVIGRSITAAADPVAAALKISQDLAVHT